MMKLYEYPLPILTARQLLAPIYVRHFATSRTASNNASEEDIQVARKWFKDFHAETIPKSVGELSFSRSSGPGGQNVNKYDDYIFRPRYPCANVLEE